MSELNDGSLDLPYESQEPTHIEDEFVVSGGVVVMAATLPDDDTTHPALIFRFAKPDGSGFYDPVLLALTDQQMRDVVGLVSQASRDALAAAREARRQQ